MSPIVLAILIYLTCSDQHSITVTRFPSTRSFALDGRVTVSGVEVRFSDPKLQPVHTIYGLRYASLGGEGDSVVSGPGNADVGESYHHAAKRRFMHSVAAFIYETPARGHLQKTGPPPECPQPRRAQSEHDNSFDDWTARIDTTVASSHHLLQNPQPATQPEDCLTLNIFVPEAGAENINGHVLPVLIFVHGDSYEHGSGNAYDFSLFSSLGSVIVVTLNYRLGVLVWPTGNIPFHLQGPNYYGIKRLVLFDGSANAPWATSVCDTDIKSLIESKFQIQQSSSATVFDLLQDLPISSILEIQRNLSRLGLERCFAPLPRKQQVVTKRPTLFDRVDLMYGQTEFAGSLFYRNAAIESSVNKFMPALSYLLEHIFQVSAYPLNDLLKYIYVQSDTWTENDDINEEKTKIYKIFTDALFWTPGLATLRQHETGQEQNSEFGSPGSSRYAVHFSRAGYGDDLNLLLGSPFLSVFQLKTNIKRRVSNPVLGKPIVGFNEPSPPNDVLDVTSAYRNHYTTFWMNVFPKIAANNRRTPPCKGRAVTHFAVPEVQYKEATKNGHTSAPSKSIEQAPMSEHHFAVSNETVEFPSFYDTSQVPSSTPGDAKEGYKRIFLLTIVVGLSLFLLNIVFTATFYFCHQQRKDGSSGILISASEADHRENKNHPPTKPTNAMTGCHQSVVKLPLLGSALETPFQQATAKLQTNFQDVAFETLQGSPNQLRQVYPPGGNRTTPMTDHRTIMALDSSQKKEEHERPSACMI
ncbi:unnamed protein product [Hydatigera taeniaeformis]|uniref:COesterase domain-containing protein n=1 Tax=Hydatigena taeniaeformis TaxID=6205 RepID=A0A0R3WMC8_HYDTA|nr:unnamed protein product [Hydatigera taeniaeformis]